MTIFATAKEISIILGSYYQEKVESEAKSWSSCY